MVGEYPAKHIIILLFLVIGFLVIEWGSNYKNMLYLFWGVVPKKKKCKLVPRNDLVFVLFLKETLYSKTCNIEESSAHNLLARVIYINRF